ncbi:MAG: hypothetical protein AB1779_02745 [Candidatus Thermoplasmatota archaeon]
MNFSNVEVAELLRELRKKFEGKRWFGSRKGKLNVLDFCLLYSTPSSYTFATIFKVGEEEFFLPIFYKNGYVCEAEEKKKYYETLIKNFQKNKEILTMNGNKIIFKSNREMEGKLEKAELINADTTNILSVLQIGGKKYFCKTYRLISQNLEPIFLLTLNKMHFKYSPKIFCSCEYKKKIVSIIEEYIENFGDCFSLFKKLLSEVINGDIEKEFESIKKAEEIGRIIAQMHNCIIASDDKIFSPEEIKKEDVDRWKNWIFKNLSYCNKFLHENTKKKIKTAIENISDYIGLIKTRTHQDLHLAQFIISRNKKFFILDFEGEPLRREGQKIEKLTPIRDIATMIRSISYVKHAELKGNESKIADLWEKKVANAMLRSYLATVKEKKKVVGDRELKKILNVWLLEKAIYEVKYELKYRPEYVSIPLAGIKEILDNGRD